MLNKHLQSKQQKHLNKVWHMFQVHNKDSKTMLVCCLFLTLKIFRPYRWLWKCICSLAITLLKVSRMIQSTAITWLQVIRRKSDKKESFAGLLTSEDLCYWRVKLTKPLNRRCFPVNFRKISHRPIYGILLNLAFS